MSNTLYDEIFEGKKPRKCENCLHHDACYEYSHAVEMEPDKCDLFEEDGKTLYDELFGKEI